jgi:transposase
MYRGAGKSEASRCFGVSLSSVKRYTRTAREGKPLTPKKRPGSRPKMDERARRLLESDMEERTATTLPQRREYLRKVAGLKVSESTVSILLKRIGWTQKEVGRCERDEFLRAALWTLVAGEAGIDAKRLVFVDEMARKPRWRLSTGGHLAESGRS